MKSLPTSSPQTLKGVHCHLVDSLKCFDFKLSRDSDKTLLLFNDFIYFSQIYMNASFMRRASGRNVYRKIHSSKENCKQINICNTHNDTGLSKYPMIHF